MEQAEWDETEARWRTTVNLSAQKDSEYLNSYVIDSDFLVSAVGQLNLPREPDIPGLHDFQGKLMHSARWDWSYDYKGKRVAVIGNGIDEETTPIMRLCANISQVPPQLRLSLKSPQKPHI